MSTHSTIKLSAVARAVVLAGLLALAAGCSGHRSGLAAAPPGTPTVSANPQDPIANNPPQGKPNHLSPDMQAMIEHYRSLGRSAN